MCPEGHRPSQSQSTQSWVTWVYRNSLGSVLMSILRYIEHIQRLPSRVVHSLTGVELKIEKQYDKTN